MTQDATKTAIGGGGILPAGTLISDRYRIDRLLGVGGMGMVYLSHDEQLDIDVALKVLRDDGTRSGDVLARFRRELVLARQISHRNVVRIHDIGQAGELHYISMDYVDGRSLKQVLGSDGALETSEALRIACDLAEALAEAHRAGVVHRDIKPGNVLLSADRALLTDFGIARSLQSDGLTRTGEIVGTLDYLSPEQALGKDVDGRSDIYALGLLLYEMLSGERPFTGETAEEILAQRTLGRPRDLSAITAKTGPAVRRIIERCLAVDPDERYASADELLADLRSGGAKRRLRIRPAAVAAVVLVVAAVAAAWYAVTQLDIGSPEMPAAVARSASIAVLPFDIVSTSGDLESFSPALTEQLADRLAESATLPVVAVQRVASTLSDLSLDAAALSASDRDLVADLLDAEYLVTSSLQQVDSAYRLTARLWHAGSGGDAPAASVDFTDIGGLFGAVDRLAEQLRQPLSADNGGARPAPESQMPTFGEAAMLAYAQGVDSLTAGNTAEAVTSLQEAVRLEPEFAKAWDRLAVALAGAGRDREAARAAASAVDALGNRGGRAAAMIRAREAALGGDADTAASRLENLLGDYPGDAEARLMLAEIYGEAGRLPEARAELDALVADSPDHPVAWYLLGKFAILGGDSRRAVDDYLVKALVVQNRLSNPEGRANVMNALGIAYSQLGESDTAVRYYRDALGLREQIGDDRGVAAVLTNLARIDVEAGNYDAARDGLLAARDRLAGIGDLYTVASLENELGFLNERRGQFRTALGHYREALRLRDDLGDQRALGESYNNVGFAYFVLGEYDNASVFNERSRETFAKTDNREGVMFASQARGMLEIARGRYDDALKALLESLQLAREFGDRQAEAIAEGYIGRARHLQGRYAAAASSYADALADLVDIGDDRGLAEFTLLDAGLAIDSGSWETASDGIQRAGELLESDDNAARRSLHLRLSGHYRLAREKDADEAGALFDRALQEAEASGEREAILHARLALARNRSRQQGGSAAIEDLADINATAERMGHAELRYESGLALGRALFADGRLAAAEEILRDSLLPQRGADPYHESWRMQALLSDVLDAGGQPEQAAQARERAVALLAARRELCNPAQQEALAALPLVQRLTNPARTDDEG